MIEQGATTHVDMSVRKQCLQGLGRMLDEWHRDPGFQHFAVERFGGDASLAGLLSSRVHICDAGSLGLLQEVRKASA